MPFFDKLLTALSAAMNAAAVMLVCYGERSAKHAPCRPMAEAALMRAGFLFVGYGMFLTTKLIRRKTRRTKFMTGRPAPIIQPHRPGAALCSRSAQTARLSKSASHFPTFPLSH